jgi:hypothetical protein
VKAVRKCSVVLCEYTIISFILKSKWVLNERQARPDNQVEGLCRRDIREACDEVESTISGGHRPP